MNTLVYRFAVLFTIISFPICAFAQDESADAPAADDDAAKTLAEVKAGHSYHGEAFNEGPRQKAYLMGGTGNINFPVTTKSELVQKFINQGVGQLHGFWTLEAERTFRHAASLEPDCAMAYWGAALANRGNSKRGKGFIAEAVKRKDKVSEREKMYIDALDAYFKVDAKKKKERAEKYTKALEDILAKYPDDLEAKAFLALQLYRNKSAGIAISSYFAVDALIQQIIKVEPLHPAHHFRIHLWDYRRAEEALTSAAVCGQGSPSIAHMWHMPGHIYSRLKRYHDAVWQQEASARVDHAHMMRDRVMPDQIGNFAHNNEWLIRNMIYIGRLNDSIDLAKNMISLPRHPKYNTLAKNGSTKYGRTRLFDVLKHYELWEEMIKYCDSAYLEPTDVESEQIKRLRYLGTAYFETGKPEKGEEAIADLQQRLKKRETERDEAVAKAEEKAKKEKKKEKEIEKAKSDAKKKFATKIREVQRPIDELIGRRAKAAKDYETAVTHLQKATADPLQLARVRWQAGKKDEAIKAIQGQVDGSRKNQVLPLAYLVEAQWQAGKKDEAGKTFQRLRELSSTIDLNAPAFARLAPIASELKLPADWRNERQDPGDVGDRPELDTLGPFRWQPSPAPAWELPNVEGKKVAFKQFQGKPVVLIFYLGYGCLHCAEQLQAFAPVMKDFESAGISMLAISTDDQAGLRQSIENYDGGPMPIPLVANPEMDVFKSYRAYDDFEQQPLHGTYLIDREGFVLWQDISHEPFMDHKFLLGEAKRLLAQREGKPLKIETAKVEEPKVVEEQEVTEQPKVVEEPKANEPKVKEQ